MSPQIKSILLIDDSPADNFLTARVIKKSGICENVIALTSGKEALNYLFTEDDNAFPNPELIFLDINMPGMNGWEFLESYQLLPKEMRKSIIVCMLTTAMTDADKIIAERLKLHDDSTEKPLTEKKVFELAQRYFPDRFPSQEPSETSA